jgi:hypothetical protein
MPASAADRVILDCRGADIRVRRACRTQPVAAHGKAHRGSRRRGERGARPGRPNAAGTRGRLLDGRLQTGCPETRGDPGQAEGCQPRNHPASQASAGGQAPGTSRRGPPVRSQSPGRSKVRLPSMSAPRHAVTLSDTGRHGERAHCRLIDLASVTVASQSLLCRAEPSVLRAPNTRPPWPYAAASNQFRTG